ncbi:MAG: aconitase X swivel domain-containing protein [Acidimicrobiia bacterium]
MTGRPVTEGRPTAVVLDEPLSLWGGFDPATGRIIDRRHPQAGTELAGHVVVMPSGRGSSSSSSVLAEAIRAGTAPAAFLLLEPDEILSLGALVAEELYGRTCPVVVLEAEAYRSIRTGDVVTIPSHPG